MGRYIIRRLIMIIPIVLLVSIFVFSIIHAIPGDVVDAMLGNRANDEAKAELRSQLGLNKSIIVQYWIWLSNVFSGNFGKSIHTGVPVLTLISEKLPATLLLAFASLVLTTLISIPLGTVAASNKNTLWDFAALGSALFATSMPSFWLGIMLILLFGVYTGWLPSMGYVRFFENPLECLRHLILPGMTLAAGMLGAITRMTRSQMLEELGQDYIRTAKAKGVKQRNVVYRHALRNALNPVITVLGIQFGWTLGSAMVVEEIFAWPGIGRLVIGSIYSRDYPILQGCVLVVACLYIAVSLIVDVLYGFLDPRIKFE